MAGMQTAEILEGTGQELSDRFKAIGTQRLRVMILPELPETASFFPDDFEAAMDAIGEGTEDIPSDPTVTYNREDIYSDHD
ncbi:MAG: hypothetical protein SFU56_12910 [Capsulimonadales bacterium]|nr:hypothetical protein [Capsulimonadales bacterium]